jgi:hypothetical protein
MGCTSDANDTVVAPHAQLPPAQVLPGPQLVPQAPQFEPSVSVSTQEFVHHVWSEAHAQVPPAQERGASQGVSHAPQCTALVLKSAQAAPHCMRVPQPEEQVPLRHASPAPLAVAQSPL